MLELLYRLQKLEAEENGLVARQKSSEEYLQLRRLKARFAQEKESLLTMQEDLKALQHITTAIPQELQHMEQKIAAEKEAVYNGSISNLRELEARQMQAAALEEKCAALRGELQTKQEQFKHKLQQAKTLQKTLTETHEAFMASHQRYSEMRDSMQSELDALALAKDALLAEADEEMLQWYEQQKPLFGGLPVAKLDENHVCDGCRTMVTPMLYKKTVFGEQTRCEKCGRYLFVDHVPDLTPKKEEKKRAKRK